MSGLLDPYYAVGPAAAVAIGNLHRSVPCPG